MSIDKDTTVLLGCGCVSRCCILAVDRWKFSGEDEEWWFDIYTRPGETASRRWRWRQALRLIRGRDVHFEALTLRSDEIAPLRDLLNAWPPMLSVTTSTWSTNAPDLYPGEGSS